MLRLAVHTQRGALGRFVLSALLAGSLLHLTSCMVEISRTPRHEMFKPGTVSDESEHQARIENPDGSVVLLTTTPAYLVSNLRNCIVLDESDLIFDQLLSNDTKKVYESRDLDPHEAVQWLMSNKRDVLILLNRMGNPMLNSTNVTWESSGPAIRFKIYTPIRLQMRYTILDVVRENGQFRLLMIS